MLGGGRIYIGLVPDASKMEEITARLGMACATAVQRGWFSTLYQPLVTVGEDRHPVCVPRTNMSVDAAKALAEQEVDIVKDDEHQTGVLHI